MRHIHYIPCWILFWLATDSEISLGLHIYQFEDTSTIHVVFLGGTECDVGRMSAVSPSRGKHEFDRRKLGRNLICRRNASHWPFYTLSIVRPSPCLIICSQQTCLKCLLLTSFDVCLLQLGPVHVHFKVVYYIAKLIELLLAHSLSGALDFRMVLNLADLPGLQKVTKFHKIFK